MAMPSFILGVAAAFVVQAWENHTSGANSAPSFQASDKAESSV